MNRPVAEILSQGNELTEGQIINSNAQWLSSKLTGLGFRVARHTCVGDSLEELCTVLLEISTRADLCISTGGLGPTSDDLTAEAVAQSFGQPLELDPVALKQIEDWFSRSSRIMPESNRRQAFLPRGARRLDNHWGTAPGFCLRHGGCQFLFLPGVPSEMVAFFGMHLEPQLLRDWPQLLKPRQLVFQTLGLGESQVAERAMSVPSPPGTLLGYRARGPETELKVRIEHTLDQATLSRYRSALANCLGDALYAASEDMEGPSSLADWVGQYLEQKALKLYCRESLSMGGLSLALAEGSALVGSEIHPAASPPLAIENEAVIEHELAALAEELLHRRHVDLSLVERWCILEPPNPEGRLRVTLWTLAARPSQQFFRTRTLRGTPDQIRQAAVLWSLDGLRRLLEIPWAIDP